MRLFMKQGQNGCRRNKGLSSYGIKYLKILFRECPVILTAEFVISVVTCNLPLLFSSVWGKVLEDFQGGTFSWGLLMALLMLGALKNSYYYFTEIPDTIFRYQASLAMQRHIHEKGVSIEAEKYEDEKIYDKILKSKTIFCYGDAFGFVFLMFHLTGSAASWIGAVISSVLKSPALLSIFLVFPLCIILEMHINNETFKLRESLPEAQKKTEDRAGYLFRYSYIKETKFRDKARFFLEKWGKDLQHEMKIKEKIQRNDINRQFIVGMLETLEYGTAVSVCLILYAKRKIGVGDLGTMIVLVGAIHEEIETMIEAIGNIHEELGKVKLGFDFLEMPDEEAVNEEKTTKEKTQQNGDIMLEVKNASYSYKGQIRKAMDDVSLQLRKGELIAVVGSNGAGKSTLIKVMMGLLRPQSGTVFRPGTDPAKIVNDGESSKFEGMSSVFQDFNHYGMTLEENIVMRGETDNRKLLKLASDLELDDMRKRLIMQKEDVLGKEYNGEELSGGQWQQIAILRGCWKDSEILFLDEPTSAIDPFKEKKLHNNFKKMLNGKCGILITHRLSGAVLADRIVVMNEGKIIESGTKEELMKRRGAFYQMWDSQKQLYEG